MEILSKTNPEPEDMEYDPETDAKGDGDILVGGELLGDEYSKLIVGYLEYWNWAFADTALQNDLEEVPPLTLSEDGVVVELPGMSTEPDVHRLHDAPRLLHVCGGPFKGTISADAMGLGKSLTVAMTVMLSGKTRGPHGAPTLVITTVSCMD
jgi:hypothetical protein